MDEQLTTVQRVKVAKGLGWSTRVPNTGWGIGSHTQTCWLRSDEVEAEVVMIVTPDRTQYYRIGSSLPHDSTTAWHLEASLSSAILTPQQVAG